MVDPHERPATVVGATVEAVELRILRLPMVRPFVTAGSLLRERSLVVVRVRADGVDGWAECAALPDPTYTHEYVDGAFALLHKRLIPRLWDPTLPAPVDHPMASAALDTARRDAELRRAGISLAASLGATRTRVPAGVAVGIALDVDTLLAEVARHLATGYRRVKLKIQPGWDIEPVRAVRDLVGRDVLLQVDANGAYRVDDAGRLSALDDLDLACIEQPLPADDLLGHVELARRLQTPVCLDESLISPTVVANALDLGACSVVCVKPGRLGGIDAAVEVHDLCRDAGVDAWCGGMLETAIGRATLLGLAALPGFTLPGDLSASGRWYDDDLGSPLGLDAAGTLAVPDGAGIGPAPDLDALDRYTVERVLVRRP